MKHAYLGIDIGSISTKGVIIDEDNRFLASEYIWTEGNPIEAVRRLLKLLEQQFDKEHYTVVSVGTTGSARRLICAVVGGLRYEYTLRRRYRLLSLQPVPPAGRRGGRIWSYCA